MKMSNTMRTIGSVQEFKVAKFVHMELLYY